MVDKVLCYEGESATDRIARISFRQRLYHISQYDANNVQTRPDIPVEAFQGESFGPWQTGWRAGPWGCYMACQDIRTTSEWVMGYYVDRYGKFNPGQGQVQARAKWTYGFTCPEGMISETVIKQSMREPETDEEIIAAIKLLMELTQYHATFPKDMLHIYGEIGLITTCHCIEATDEEAEEARREVMRHKKRLRNKAQDLQLDTTKRSSRIRLQAWQYVRKPRKKARTCDDSSGLSTSDVAESSRAAEERMGDEQMCMEETDDIDVLGVVDDFYTCYDFQYPDTTFDYDPTDTRLQQEEEEFNETDVRSYLSAFLQDFGGFNSFDQQDPPNNGKGPAPPN